MCFITILPRVDASEDKGTFPNGSPVMGKHVLVRFKIDYALQHVTDIAQGATPTFFCKSVTDKRVESEPACTEEDVSIGSTVVDGTCMLFQHDLKCFFRVDGDTQVSRETVTRSQGDNS